MKTNICYTTHKNCNDNFCKLEKKMAVVTVTERIDGIEHSSKVLTDKTNNELLSTWYDEGEQVVPYHWEYDNGTILAWVSSRKPCTKAEAKILARFL